MPTEHHYTRQTPNGKPASGSTRPGESAHSARPQGNSAQRHSGDHSHSKSHTGAPREYAGTQAHRSSHSQGTKGSAPSYAAKNAGYASAYESKSTGSSAYAKSAGSSVYANSASYPPKKKKKKKTLKRLWKQFCKKMFVVEEKPVDDLTYAQNTRAAVSAKPFSEKAKKTLLSVLRTVARAVYLFVRKAYQSLMKLPPRTLLIGSGTLGLVLVVAIILAIALPGKQSSEDAQQQLAAFASDETQTAAFDSGTVDPYANSETAPETQASVADPATDTAGQTVDATTSQAGVITLSEELKAGDDGEIVSTIQTRLMELGYMDSDEPTQHFGPLTKSALKAFQRHNGLDDDGICGQTTFDILQQEDAKVYVMQLGDSGPDAGTAGGETGRAEPGPGGGER